MQKERFKATIAKISMYFDRKYPSSESVDLWFDKTRNIPDEALEHVYDHITGQFDSPPRNMGNAFRDAWENYKNSNPHKIVAVSEKCPECKSGGLLWARKKTELGYVAEFVFRCAFCNNWRNHYANGTEVPAVSRLRLEQTGFKNILPKQPDMAKGVQ